ncbi:Manganese transport system ATP-binding protein MntB [Labeo rohita]|uniref:Manganese transport system ATP-binding protein MntB n=1 Tax=Labeo rohita TaxID=84645 RepID=A0ABQ8LL20_LABRO|nr:Manganese transport system ATP-binding protein MntB [Labeo rohita]
MTTHEKTISKQQRPSVRIPFGHRRRTDILLLKNGQMASKHPRAFPMLGELPSLAGLLLYPGKREKMVTGVSAQQIERISLITKQMELQSCGMGKSQQEKTGLAKHRDVLFTSRNSQLLKESMSGEIGSYLIPTTWRSTPQ